MSNKFLKIKTNINKIIEAEKQFNYRTEMISYETEGNCIRIAFNNYKKDIIEHYCLSNRNGSDNKSYLTVSFIESVDSDGSFEIVSNGEYTGTLGVIPPEFTGKIKEVFERQQANKFKILFDYYSYFKKNTAEIVIVPLN